MNNYPLYRKVYLALRDRIEQGEYPKGSLLPTESELEDLFNVSRVTIRKAIELLSSEGYVVTQQGRGTEVLDHKTSQKLNFISSFTETLLERGYEVTSKDCSIEKTIPPISVAADLEIDSDSKVTRLYRVRLANDKPIAIMINYIKSEIAPDLENRYRDSESLYQTLERHYGVSIDTAVETISARVASMTEADILRIPEGAPLLVSKRITYSNGKPFEVVKSTVVADGYEYSVFLKGRS